MAKRSKDPENVSRLPSAGTGPLKPETPLEAYLRRTNAAIADDCDQLITIVCKRGRVEDFISLRDNRHEVRGILEEAFSLYDMATAVVFTLDE